MSLSSEEQESGLPSLFGSLCDHERGQAMYVSGSWFSLPSVSQTKGTSQMSGEYLKQKDSRRARAKAP